MKSLLKSAAIAFSMYSRLPVPQVRWEEKNMKYVFCFFPLIGLVAGGLEAGWYFAARYAGINALLYAAVAILIMVLLTGGIHLDGYMDAKDASAALTDMEKRYQIMKDPHTGSFSVIHCCVYLLLTSGIFAQIYQSGNYKHILMLGTGYIISRALCGLLVVAVPCMKNSGLGYIFKNSAGKKAVFAVLSVYFLICIAFICYLSLSAALIIAVLLPFLILFLRAYIIRQFGGINGDLAGFSLAVAELAIGLGIVLEIFLEGAFGL